mmetsp:Transcript_42691/g.106432  ORF Transcript_42691/g.106432 Transcript_42691/m.106432 type:complete len:90 (+) Transcript_42691:1411-1680(+)
MYTQPLAKIPTVDIYSVTCHPSTALVLMHTPRGSLGNNALDADAKDCLQKAAGEAKAKGVKLKVFVDDAERDFTQEVGRRGVVSAFDLD